MHGLNIILYLVLALGGELEHVVENYAMGFKALHGNGDHDNVTFVNYGDVGFGLIMDTRLEPLMHLEVWEA